MPTQMAARAICSPASPLHSTLSGVLIGAAAAAAGLLLGRLDAATTTRRNGTPCDACNGDGYIDCLCVRWTNAHAHAVKQGCESCGGTARTRCPRCRGGGTRIHALAKVPIPVRVREPLEGFMRQCR